MNRQDSFITHDPGKEGYYPKAEVWGNWNIKISPDQLVHLWRSKDRETSLPVMCSIALIESALRPYIFRYESGHHETRGGTEFGWTSGGLFQILGMNLTGWTDWNQTGDMTHDVLVQMQMFDEFWYRLRRSAATHPLVLVYLYNIEYITSSAYNTGSFQQSCPYSEKFLRHYRAMKDLSDEAIISYLKSLV